MLTFIFPLLLDAESSINIREIEVLILGIEGLGVAVFHVDMMTWWVSIKLISRSFTSDKLKRGDSVIDWTQDTFQLFFQRATWNEQKGFVTNQRFVRRLNGSKTTRLKLPRGHLIFTTQPYNPCQGMTRCRLYPVLPDSAASTHVHSKRYRGTFSRVTAGSVCRGTDDGQPRVTVTTEKNRLSDKMSRISKQTILIKVRWNYNLNLFHLGII